MNPLELLDHDPYAQRLLASPIPARLAYTALDGTPRVVPIAYHYTDNHIVMATVEHAPKVAALAAHPHVALTIDTNDQPPAVLLIRGTAELDRVNGVPVEYLDANRKMIPDAQWSDFETQVTALYDHMIRITVTPTWAKVLDFETRAPQAVMDLARAKGLHP